MDGIALAWSDVPVELIERHHLLAYKRGGETELHFLRRSRRPLLPVWHDGRLLILAWGRRGGSLTWQRTVDDGDWVGTEVVEIRATADWHGGVWYVRQGIRGLVASGEAYLSVDPSSYYYRVMT